MWENIFFSANIVLPSFTLIFLGRLITLKQLMTPDQMDRIGRLTFQYLLSAKVYDDIAANDPGIFSDASMALFCEGALLISFAVIWFLAARLMRRKESVGAFVQGCFRCSFTVLGMTMVETFAGKEGVARSALLLAMATVTFNILACLVLTKPGGDQSVGSTARTIARSVVTNPLIIAVTLGLMVSLLGITLPRVIQKPLSDLGNMAAPLSLLCVGSSLNMGKVKGCFRYAVTAACVKTWGTALAVIPAAVLCGFRGFELTVIAIFFTSANPSTNYVMALAMGNDSNLAATGTVLSTVMCIFTTLLAITALKTLALI